MLILMRRAGEEIVCRCPDGTKIVIALVSLDRNRARIGVEAPLSVTVDRAEIDERKKAGLKPVPKEEAEEETGT